MTHILHCAGGTTAATGAFPLLLVADHFLNDREADAEESEREENG